MENTAKTMLNVALDTREQEQPEKYVMTITGRTPGKSTSSILNGKHVGLPDPSVSDRAEALSTIALHVTDMLLGVVAAARTTRDLRQATLLVVPTIDRMQHRLNKIGYAEEALDREIIRLFGLPDRELQNELIRLIDRIKRDIQYLSLPPSRYDYDELRGAPIERHEGWTASDQMIASLLKK